MVSEKAAAPKRLGRGLESLMPGSSVRAKSADADSVRRVPAGMIRANAMQPRADFDQQALDDLASSIAVHGVLQPIMVRKMGEGYELIAGERRFRSITYRDVGSRPKERTSRWARREATGIRSTTRRDSRSSTPRARGDTHGDPYSRRRSDA